MNLKKTFVLMLVALGCVSILSQPILAGQSRPGAGKHPQGMMNPDGRLGESLNLTADQKANIKTIADMMKQQVKAVRDDKALTAAQQKARIKEIHQERKAQMDQVLTSEQRQKLSEIRDKAKSERKQGLEKRKAALAKLNLTDDQKAKMKAIHQSAGIQTKALRDDKPLSPEQRKAKMKEIRQSTKDQIRQILTPEQQKMFDEMKGNAKCRAGKNCKV